jgi:hypothetical protein
MKMNGAGVASSLVFMLLISMVRLGNKSTFGSGSEEELWTRARETAVKEANKAGAKQWKRPSQR